MANQPIIDAMNDPFDNLDIDRLPADVRAVLLPERAALMIEKERADLLEKSNDHLAVYVSRLEHLIKEMKRRKQKP